MNTCLRCNHTWKPHTYTKNSRSCPKCHSPYWDTPRRYKVYFDPLVHTEGRNILVEYIDKIHNGNVTAAAYCLGCSYPYIYNLVRNWKIIPQDIIDKVISLKGEEPKVKEKPPKDESDITREFWKEHDRIARLTVYKQSSEIAAKIGISKELLHQYVKNETPVPLELLDHMKTIVS